MMKEKTMKKRKPQFIETVLILQNGRIPLLEEHYARFSSTIRRYSGSPPSLREFEALLLGTLSASSPSISAKAWRCRLVYEANGRLVERGALPFIPKKLERIARVELPSASYPLKFADRSLFASLHERFPGYDEIIITRQGFLSDGTFTNLYLRRSSGRLLTPADALLAGCRRARLMKEGTLLPSPLNWEELEPHWQIGFINALNPPGQLGEFALSEVTNLTIDLTEGLEVPG